MADPFGSLAGWPWWLVALLVAVPLLLVVRWALRGGPKAEDEVIAAGAVGIVVLGALDAEGVVAGVEGKVTEAVDEKLPGSEMGA